MLPREDLLWGNDTDEHRGVRQAVACLAVVVACARFSFPLWMYLLPPTLQSERLFFLGVLGGPLLALAVCLILGIILDTYRWDVSGLEMFMDGCWIFWLFYLVSVGVLSSVKDFALIFGLEHIFEF